MPQGIERREDAARRAPWVTFAIVVLGLASLLPVATSSPLDGELAVLEAWEYWEAHPYLELAPPILDAVGAPESPVRRKSLLESIRAKRATGQPAATERAEQQAELDRRTARATADPAEAGAGSLVKRFGVAPGISPPSTWLTHLFVHASWISLAASVAFLLLLGPALEQRLGHLAFLALYLTSGVLAAAAHVASPQAHAMMLTGSVGALAGVAGALLALGAGARIPLLPLALGMSPRPDAFAPPGWMLVALFVAALGTGRILNLEAGISPGSGAGGFAAGAVLGMALRALQPKREMADAMERSPAAARAALLERRRSQAGTASPAPATRAAAEPVPAPADSAIPAAYEATESPSLAIPDARPVDEGALDLGAPSDAGPGLDLDDAPFVAPDPVDAGERPAPEAKIEEPPPPDPSAWTLGPELDTAHDLGPSLAAALPRFDKIEVTEARPRALRDGSIALTLSGGRAVMLALDKVQAIALVRLAAPGAAARIVLDLALTWSVLSEGGTLRVVRLAGAESSLATLVGVAEKIAALGHVAVLTPLTAPPPEFADPADYERDVLLLGS